MEIRNIQINHTHKYAVLSAEVKNGVTDEVLYFAVKHRYKKFIARDASSFLAGIFLPMAKMGQKISVAGLVSRCLVKDLKRASGFLKRAKLGFCSAGIVSLGISKKIIGKHIACFFSGDIESTAKFLERFKTKKKITHLIYIRGFDGFAMGESSGLKNSGVIFRRVRRLAQAQKMQLVTVNTNIRDFTDPIADWSFASLGTLSAVGFLLQKGFKGVLIPGLDRKTYSVLEKDWLSQTVRKMNSRVVQPKTFLWRVRGIIRNLDARYNGYRLRRFLTRTGIIQVGHI